VEQPRKRRTPHGRGSRRARFVVDEHEVGDPLVVHEGRGIAPITRADGDDVGVEAADSGVMLAQLRGVLAAVQSTEVPEEHENARFIVPEVTEPVWHTVGVGKRTVGERVEVHAGTLRGGGHVGVTT
jgi:hypothetical protein